MTTLDDLKHWRTPRVEARIWWCGDEECDCTQPMIERITPNVEAGYPWIRRETLWEGRFMTEVDYYELGELEQLQYAPLREACQRFGVALPAGVPAGPPVTGGDTAAITATTSGDKGDKEDREQ